MTAALAVWIAETFAISATAAQIVTLALTLTASAIISKMLAPSLPSAPQLPITNLQVQPATNNKLPVVYGTCYIGGTITDVSISSDNQQLYYVLSLCEVTGGSSPDTFSFGNIYYGGRLCLFAGYTYTGIGITVSSVTGNRLTYTGTPSITIQAGTTLTFQNTGTPIVYTVAGVNPTTNTIDFTIALDPTIGGGAAIYQFTNGTGTTVYGLQDVSTGIVDTNINGLINIYLYRNGSSNPVNSSLNAQTVMSASGLTYQWNSSKLMTNTCFAILHLTYNQNAGITGIQQTQFEVINPRNNAGDVIFDYLTNAVYGAAIPAAQVDSTSIAALNTYANQTVTFNNYLGVALTQPRFKFNGALDTTQTVLDNLQSIANCADCLIRYNEIYGIWSVVVQSSTYTVAMDINDSNMVSSLSITSMDISNTYNIAQCQFPDITLNSSFNTSTINLALVDPSLLYPNEPQNSQSIQLPLCNNDVQAQLLATRFLKQARLDLQVTCQVNYIGMELEAGDIVTVTNANYGWSAKLFQVFKVEQNFAADGAITVSLTLQEYDPNVFNDASVQQYVPPPKSGLQNPLIFGTIPAPTISNVNYGASTFDVTVETSSQGFISSVNVYYSSLPNPSADPTLNQLIFAGTLNQPSGLSWGNNVILSPLILDNVIPAGTWYFFSQMMGSKGNSGLSPASVAFTWTPGITVLADPVSPVLYANVDSSGSVNKVRVTIPSFDGTMPLAPAGLAVMYSMFDQPNSVTITSGETGGSLLVGAVDIEATGTLPILAGSTPSLIVNTTSVAPNNTDFSLSSKFWAQFGTSQWRKATGITTTGYQFNPPFDVTPLAGQTLNWSEISWFDQRGTDATGVYGRTGESYRMGCISDGTNYEVCSWTGVTQDSYGFHITGLVRGLEGTTAINADGLTFHYYPAPGAGTQMFVIPAINFTQDSSGAWSGSTDVNVNIPAGYSVSMTCAVYAQNEGVLYRSNIVPLTYGGAY